MKITSRKLVRKLFSDIGYRVTFKRNPFNHDLVCLGFMPKNLEGVDWRNGFHMTGDIVTAEFRAKHISAFNLYIEYSGAWLECTEQKIS